MFVSVFVFISTLVVVVYPHCAKLAAPPSELRAQDEDTSMLCVLNIIYSLTQTFNDFI